MDILFENDGHDRVTLSFIIEIEQIQDRKTIKRVNEYLSILLLGNILDFVYEEKT